MKKTSKVTDLSDQPIVDRFRMRGRLFVLTEVDAGTYSELLDDFTDVNPDTGAETLNEDGFMRALTVKALTEPRLTTKEFAALGQRMVRAIEGRCRALHLAPEPVTVVLDDGEVEVDPDEKKDEGNAG